MYHLCQTIAAQNLRCLWKMNMFSVSLLLSLSVCLSFLYSFLCLILCVFILQMFRIQNDGINPRAAFITFGGMLLGLATFPMYELLMTQFKRTIKYIVNIGFAAMILRIILWFFYNFFHIYLIRSSNSHKMIQIN